MMELQEGVSEFVGIVSLFLLAFTFLLLPSLTEQHSQTGEAAEQIK
jgi:hypothetical protein